MHRKTTIREMMKRIDNLQDLMNKQTQTEGVVVINLGRFIESDVTGTFNDYITSKLKGMSDDSTILIDDMAISIDIYLPTGILYDLDKESLKEFVDATASGDEIRFMELYVKTFENMFDMDDVLNNGSDFFKDFAEHIKVLTIDELVNRYKEKRFFRMT